MMKTLTVRETIHHGSYYKTREQAIFPTWDGFVALMARSPYNSVGLMSLADNMHAARTFASLITTGRAERGWARYEVIATNV